MRKHEDESCRVSRLFALHIVNMGVKMDPVRTSGFRGVGEDAGPHVTGMGSLRYDNFLNAGKLIRLWKWYDPGFVICPNYIRRGPPIRWRLLRI